MVYLIDFENVSNIVFEELELIEKVDKIIIFYSEKASKISISSHITLENSKIPKEYVAIKTGGKNALDFQLSTYLGYLIAKDQSVEYVIISNDTGFDYVCAFWKNHKVKVLRSPSFLIRAKEKIHTDIKNVLSPLGVDIQKVLSIVDKYKTKQGINNALVKEFGSEKTGVVYKSIKSFLNHKK